MSSEYNVDHRPTFVKISLPSLKSNFLWLKEKSPDFLCPMVKANAYGHGDISVSLFLESLGCDTLGVGLVEEGCGLRSCGFAGEILVFGFSGPEAIKALLAHRLTPVISDQQQLMDLVTLVREPTKVHLKFNTGMNRRGFSLGEVKTLLSTLEKNIFLQVQGVCTHLLEGGDLSAGKSGYSFGQLEKFQTLLALLPFGNIQAHVYNSAAMTSVLGNQLQTDFGSRPGLLLYGIPPIKGQAVNPFISPVMEFHSKIVSTQRVKSNEVVSYGGIWKASRDSVIGILPAGYADGVCRSLSNRGQVLVRGQKVPIVGHVCMDYVMVDLTDLQCKASDLLGSPAVFFGSQGDQVLSVAAVADMAGRVSYEILTGISERVPRVYQYSL